MLTEPVGRLIRSMRLRVAIAVGVTLILSGLTYRQVGVWRDTITLFEHAIACDPENYQALGAAGAAYVAKGDDRVARELYMKALQLAPFHYPAHNNLAKLLSAQGRPDEALVHYEKALHGFPDHPERRNELTL